MARINDRFNISAGVGRNRNDYEKKKRENRTSRHVDRIYIYISMNVCYFVIFFQTFTFLACVYVLLLGACTVTHTQPAVDAMMSYL